MVILVPWDPVAFVLGLLSALILAAISDQRSYAAKKDPSAVSMGDWQPAAADNAKRHSVGPIPHRAS
jgi:hypothetical protein